MIEPLRFNLDIGPARSRSLDGCLYALANLPREQRYVVSVREWHPPLAHNLRARLHIPIREMAEFCGYSETQMKSIIKEAFYPRTERRIAGKLVSVPVDTMELTPAQARAVEVHIHAAAADIGCPLSAPQSQGERI
jgi:hypothetical protein